VDVHLPDGCGLSLLKSFREKFPVLGVLIVTAAAAPETRAQALDMGALKIIGKPFTAREILGEVTKVLGS
jgi:DNA-binding response OmpR family regulator